MRFESKVALVTGAGGGIGRALAQRFAAEGAALALVDRDAQKLAETDETLPGGTRRALFPLDVADEEAVAACVAEVLAEFGRIDALANNAGIIGDMTAAPDQDGANWRAVMAVNLYGAVFFTKHVSRAMIAAGSGAIVNTASVAGIRSGAGGNAYSASKAGLISFTQTSACDLGQHGIRVNAVCPGLIETDMTKPVFDYARGAGKEDRLGYRCELRRYGHPHEVAAAVAFLASDDASYITGQALPVDGGNTASLNLPGMKF
jgi:NAD(P)-dependent dehydrogenase (short-subunit alcohol dehydrogenase family)